MPRIERTARVEWEGNLARGHGSLAAVSSGAFAGLPYRNATRVGEPDGETSPEELLAAAHGSCFATSLAGELTGLGLPPERLEVTCRIRMDEVAGAGHQIVGSQVSVRANVPGADAAALAEGVRLADEGCPFSALLKRSGCEVTVAAELAGG
jgi:osmotically inducible protein OsmC